MSRAKRVLDELSKEDFNRIKTSAIEREYKKGELIFSEGDAADYVYFIESGQVSVFIRKFNCTDEICALGPGAYFGEMAIFSNDKRTASVAALEDTALLSVDRKAFLEVLETTPSLAVKIKGIMARRNEELILKENLVDITGIKAKHLHVGISGDPSLRETVFTRERYESVADRILPLLELRLVDLLTKRCVYHLSVAFNSGEIHTSSVFDPFSDEVHQAGKFVDESYMDRHFVKIPYEEKTSVIRYVYRAVADAPAFVGLPERFKKIFTGHYGKWEPVAPEDIANTVSRLTSLRNIPNYYLRNFTMSTIQDIIRMQFNCDGTQIVSAEDYQRVIREMI
jgi:CRP-like cAMP-binding protein